MERASLDGAVLLFMEVSQKYCAYRKKRNQLRRPSPKIFQKGYKSPKRRNPQAPKKVGKRAPKTRQTYAKEGAKNRLLERHHQHGFDKNWRHPIT